MNNLNKHSACWKLGLFYYNKDDKKIFPPKRFGWGWTVNFANPLSIFVFLLTLIAIWTIIKWLK